MSYNNSGQVQLLQDWGNRGDLVLTYVGSELTGVWEREGVVTTYGYDPSSHQLTSITDPAGYHTTYTYDATTGGVATRSVAGRESLYFYGFGSGPTSLILHRYNELGFVWTHTTENGYPTGQIDPCGNVQTYVYGTDPTVPLQYNHPVAFTNGLGETTSYCFDINGYFLAQQDPLGHITTYQRDSFGNITQLINALGYTTTYLYGSSPQLRQLQTVIDPLGRRTTLGYQSNGLPQTTEDALGNVTTLLWNNLGVQTNLINPLGFYTTYLYDSRGNQTVAIDALGRSSTVSYDLQDRATSQQESAGEHQHDGL